MYNYLSCGHCRLIFVIGVLPNKVPNYYPVTTDSNLIFMVLRDPPGGLSSASIIQGSLASFEIGIDGMYTYHSDKTSIGEVQLGFEDTESGFKQTQGIRSSAIHSVDVRRVSHYEYSYTFNFQSTISTSTNPNVAGHASDVIIGGGIDLVTSEAIVGKALE
jgi:hypothetical protein